MAAPNNAPSQQQKAIQLAAINSGGSQQQQQNQNYISQQGTGAQNSVNPTGQNNSVGQQISNAVSSGNARNNVSSGYVGGGQNVSSGGGGGGGQNVSSGGSNVVASSFNVGGGNQIIGQSVSVNAGGQNVSVTPVSPYNYNVSFSENVNGVPTTITEAVVIPTNVRNQNAQEAAIIGLGEYSTNPTIKPFISSLLSQTSKSNPTSLSISLSNSGVISGKETFTNNAQVNTTPYTFIYDPLNTAGAKLSGTGGQTTITVTQGSAYESYANSRAANALIGTRSLANAFYSNNLPVGVSTNAGGINGIYSPASESTFTISVPKSTIIASQQPIGYTASGDVTKTPASVAFASNLFSTQTYTQINSATTSLITGLPTTPTFSNYGGLNVPNNALPVFFGTLFSIPTRVSNFANGYIGSAATAGSNLVGKQYAGAASYGIIFAGNFVVSVALFPFYAVNPSTYTGLLTTGSSFLADPLGTTVQIVSNPVTAGQTAAGLSFFLLGRGGAGKVTETKDITIVTPDTTIFSKGSFRSDVTFSGTLKDAETQGFISKQLGISKTVVSDIITKGVKNSVIDTTQAVTFTLQKYNTGKVRLTVVSSYGVSTQASALGTGIEIPTKAAVATGTEVRSPLILQLFNDQYGSTIKLGDFKQTAVPKPIFYVSGGAEVPKSDFSESPFGNGETEVIFDVTRTGKKTGLGFTYEAQPETIKNGLPASKGISRSAIIQGINSGRFKVGDFHEGVSGTLNIKANISPKAFIVTDEGLQPISDIGRDYFQSNKTLFTPRPTAKTYFSADEFNPQEAPAETVQAKGRPFTVSPREYGSKVISGNGVLPKYTITVEEESIFSNKERGGTTSYTNKYARTVTPSPIKLGYEVKAIPRAAIGGQEKFYLFNPEAENILFNGKNVTNDELVSSLEGQGLIFDLTRRTGNAFNLNLEGVTIRFSKPESFGTKYAGGETTFKVRGGIQPKVLEIKYNFDIITSYGDRNYPRLITVVTHELTHIQNPLLSEEEVRGVTIQNVKFLADLDRQTYARISEPKIEAPQGAKPFVETHIFNPADRSIVKVTPVPAGVIGESTSLALFNNVEEETPDLKLRISTNLNGFSSNKGLSVSEVSEERSAVIGRYKGYQVLYKTVSKGTTRTGYVGVFKGINKADIGNGLLKLKQGDTSTQLGSSIKGLSYERIKSIGSNLFGGKTKEEETAFPKRSVSYPKIADNGDVIALGGKKAEIINPKETAAVSNPSGTIRTGRSVIISRTGGQQEVITEPTQSLPPRERGGAKGGIIKEPPTSRFKGAGEQARPTIKPTFQSDFSHLTYPRTFELPEATATRSAFAVVRIQTNAQAQGQTNTFRTKQPLKFITTQPQTTGTTTKTITTQPQTTRFTTGLVTSTIFIQTTPTTTTNPNPNPTPNNPPPRKTDVPNIPPVVLQIFTSKQQSRPSAISKRGTKYEPSLLGLLSGRTIKQSQENRASNQFIRPPVQRSKNFKLTDIL